MNRIKEKREQSGLSQSELAKLAGISRPYLSEIETGKRNPTIKVAARIAYVLKTTKDILFFDSDVS